MLSAHIVIDIVTLYYLKTDIGYDPALFTIHTCIDSSTTVIFTSIKIDIRKIHCAEYSAASGAASITAVS